MAAVTLTPGALDQLAELPRVVRERIGKTLARLEGWPAVSGVKRLKGDKAGRYRIRTGDYRLIFRVKGDAVIVEKIGDRKDVYED
jgi:mRNA interferase RelE/StbE